jgi:hypothetical protein
MRGIVFVCISSFVNFLGKHDSGHHTYGVDVKKVVTQEDGYFHVVAPCELRNAVKMSNNLLRVVTEY